MKIKGVKLFMAILGATGLTASFLQSPPVVPKLGIGFTGKLTPGFEGHPFALFVITNQTDRPCSWARGSVESPADPQVKFCQALDSNLPRGLLAGLATTNFPAIVPRQRGQRFRIVVECTLEQTHFDQLLAKVENLFPILGSFLSPRNVPAKIASPWFTATEDWLSIAAQLQKLPEPPPRLP